MTNSLTGRNTDQLKYSLKLFERCFNEVYKKTLFTDLIARLACEMEKKFKDF